MAERQKVRSKLELAEDRVLVDVDEMIQTVTAIFENIGCGGQVAREIAEHPADRLST